MDTVVKEIARRIRGMRDDMKISVAEMAAATGVSENEYLAAETGVKDFSFTFLYKAAHRFGLDLTDLLTGESPHRSGYTLVRSGDGLPIERRAGFFYLNLAAPFRGRKAEPFMVTAPFEAGAEQSTISLNTHAGQEMDYIISGSLRVVIDGHEEIMQQGDTLYCDSGKPHGMVAVGGTSCRFLAIVIGSEKSKQEGI